MLLVTVQRKRVTVNHHTLLGGEGDACCAPGSAPEELASAASDSRVATQELLANSALPIAGKANCDIMGAQACVGAQNRGEEIVVKLTSNVYVIETIHIVCSVKKGCLCLAADVEPLKTLIATRGVLCDCEAETSAHDERESEEEDDRRQGLIRDHGDEHLLRALKELAKEGEEGEECCKDLLLHDYCLFLVHLVSCVAPLKAC